MWVRGLPGYAVGTAHIVWSDQDAVNAVKTGEEPPILSGVLARDALKLCYAEAKSITGNKIVKVDGRTLGRCLLAILDGAPPSDVEENCSRLRTSGGAKRNSAFSATSIPQPKRRPSRSAPTSARRDESGGSEPAAPGPPTR